MPKKKKLKIDDNSMFTHTDDKPNISPEERNLQSELYKKNWKDEKIDIFEKALGITPVQKQPNLKYKSRVFSPDFIKDVELLDELLNNKKYKIISWDKNWTVEGLYKVFVIYSEDLDYKDPDQVLKEIAKA